MKKVFYSICFFCLVTFSCFTGKSQNYFNEVLLPKYMYGNSFAGDLVPYVFRAQITGLTPNTVYYFYTMGVLPTDNKNSNGSGHSIVASETADFTYFNATSISPPNGGKFTTNAQGSYTGWFILVPIAHKRFTAGGEIQIQLTVRPSENDVLTGSAVRFYSASTVKMVTWGSGAVNATAIRSTAATGASAKNFVMLYDTENPSATDRPVSGAVVESDGFTAPDANTAAVYFSDFYIKNVDKVDKAWGTLVSNDLAGGIKKITRYNFDGSEAGASKSADGTWAGQNGSVSTVNASGGTSSVIVLDGAVVTLAAPVVIKKEPELVMTGVPAQAFTGDNDFNVTITTKSPAAITYSSSNTAVATIDAFGTVHIAGAGTVDIKAFQAENADYYADTAVMTMVVKVPKATPKLEFPASFPASVIVGTPDFNAGVISNAPATITYTSNNPAVVTIDDAGVLHIAGVGTADITASQAEDENFKAAAVTKTLVVADKQVPDVVFLPISARIYGDAPFDAGATATSGVAPVYSTSNATVARIVDGKIQITGAGSAVITAVFTATATYAQNSASQTLTVDKKPLIIIAEDKSRNQGESDPLFTVRYEGFVNGDTNTSGLLTQPQLSTTATAGSAPGNYPITAGGATSNNYSIAYVPGNLKVEAVLKENAISFPSIATKTYGQTDFEAGATASSGLTVSYTSSNADVAVISGTKIHITGAGAANITATQSGNGSYLAATPVTQTLTVQKALLAVTAANAEKKQGEVNPVLSVTYDGFVNGDGQAVLKTVPVAATAVTAATASGIYPITVSGGSADDYDLVYINGKLTIYPVTGASQDDLMAYCDAPGRLKVNVNSQQAVKVNIQLFDGGGKKIVDMPVSLAKGLNSYYINVNRLTAGVYLMRVAGGDLLLKSKIVIR